MPRSAVVGLLNDLLALEFRSFPAYLVETSLWSRPGFEHLGPTIEGIVANQRALCARVAALIDARGGTIETGDFPLEYTDTHDLSLDYLVGEIIACQERDVAQIEQIVGQLAADPAARDLAAEVLGAERANVDTLRKLARSPQVAGA